MTDLETQLLDAIAHTREDYARAVRPYINALNRLREGEPALTIDEVIADHCYTENDMPIMQITSRRCLDNIPLTLRIVVFFASNPEVELSANELAAKWGFSRTNAPHKLRHLVDAGVLQKAYRRAGVPQRQVFFRAGPVIRAELGYSDEHDDPPATSLTAERTP